MKNPSSLLLTAISTFLAAGCTTEIGPNGQPRSVMTPLGAAAVQTVTAAGIGAGTGALLHGVNPVAAGAISAGAGSVGSQAINAFIPKAGSQTAAQPQGNPTLFVRTSDGSFVPAKVKYVQQPDGSYVPTYPSGKQLFRQLPNGSFAPAN